MIVIYHSLFGKPVVGRMYISQSDWLMPTVNKWRNYDAYATSEALFIKRVHKETQATCNLETEKKGTQYIYAL